MSPSRSYTMPPEYSAVVEPQPVPVTRSQSVTAVEWEPIPPEIPRHPEMEHVHTFNLRQISRNIQSLIPTQKVSNLPGYTASSAEEPAYMALPTYEVKNHNSAGFMNRKPDMVVTCTDGSLNRRVAEARFDRLTAKTNIMYMDSGVSQELELESGLTQKYGLTVNKMPCHWQPGPTKRVFELVLEYEMILASFMYAQEPNYTGHAPPIRSGAVGVLHVSERLEKLSTDYEIRTKTAETAFLTEYQNGNQTAHYAELQRRDGSGPAELGPHDTAAKVATICRSDWTSWRPILRMIATTLCLIIISCIAWAYVKSPRGTMDHYVADGKDVPWVLIPLSLSSTYNLGSLMVFPVHALQPYVTLPLDTFMWVTLSVVTFISTVGAVQSLQWTASQYYNDATSGHDGYYIYNPIRGQPGKPRFLKVPPQNATVCSGFRGDFEAQDTFKRKTYRRARVELVGVGIAGAAAVLYFFIFVYTCVVVHRLKKAKRLARKGQRPGQVTDEVRRLVNEKLTSPLNYSYT